MTGRLEGAITTAATVALVAHLSASVLQNTPDSFNQDLRTFTGGWPLPGWRFFAPNPGVQNVHVLVRTRDGEGASPAAWRDVTPVVPHGWTQVVWNPRSRGPKALFDAMQQLSVLSANGAEFDWVCQSQPYDLVLSASRRSVASTAREVQFLLVNVFPSAPPTRRMRPVLTSRWEGACGGRRAVGTGAR